MEAIIELIQSGWDISIFRQKKRRDGEFVTLIQWRAKKFGMLKEHTNEGIGFKTAQEAVSDIENTLNKLA